MKMNFMKLFYLSFVSVLLITSGCSLFGEKDDDSNREVKEANNQEQDQSQPKKLAEFLNVAIWQNGFQKPSDVLYGYDKLIYVSDREANIIYQFDENGKPTGNFSLPNLASNPTKMAMDRKANLYFICDYNDTSKQHTFPAIYYIKLHESNQILSNVTPYDSIIHPYYIPSYSGSYADESLVKFVGIATFADNTFIVAKRGPNNSNSRRSSGYDNSIVVFDADRQYFGNLSTSLLPDGSGLKTINNPTALASYANPPQSNSVSRSHDFLMGMDGTNFYRVQGVTATDVQGELLYDLDSKFLTQDPQKSDRFLFSFVTRNGLIQSRFLHPSDICVTDADNKQFIFVVDSQLDSLYQFTFAGYEGVQNPNNAADKNVIVSFGGRPTSGDFNAHQLNHPEGVAFGNKRLYIADTDNKRILVYKLSTDITGQ